MLNGGYSSDIKELCDFFAQTDNPFPWAEFYEEQDALNSALTTVGIILSDRIYNAAEIVRNSKSKIFFRPIGEDGEAITENGYPDYKTAGKIRIEGFDPDFKPVSMVVTKFESELINRLNQYSLAK